MKTYYFQSFPYGSTTYCSYKHYQSTYIAHPKINSFVFPLYSRTAYQLLKRFHPNIELDRFFISQLYEYEPILQVQRTQSGGNSCSRELRSALLKRKKTYDDYHSDAILPPTILCSDVFLMNIDQSDIVME